MTTNNSNAEGILIGEFIDELFERANRSFNGRLHQAFVDWYIDAEFGDVKWKFTDDVSDAGIDAIIWRPEDVPAVVILQSKFTKNVNRAMLGRTSLSEFKKVVEAFRYSDHRFEELLNLARQDLRSTYRKANEILSKCDNWFQKRKAFRLITTLKASNNTELAQLPPESLVFSRDILRLYQQYRQAETPKARELQLEVEDKLSYADRPRGLTSYIFNAKLSDYRKYLQKNDVARLVARNIRYNLGSSIGTNIRKTYEDSPNEFWYKHNGLTIICDDYIEQNKTATLINPSVVNGAQTLYAISSSGSNSSSALVTTKVVVRGIQGRHIEDDKWLQEIIRSVNSQNRVRESDLRSNEPEQVLLQLKFRELKVYYERKRGEWREIRNEPRFRGFERLRLGDLGQILAAVSSEDGSGVLLAKQGTDFFKSHSGIRLLNKKTFPRVRKPLAGIGQDINGYQ